MGKTTIYLHGIIGNPREGMDPDQFIGLADITSQFEKAKSKEKITELTLLINSPGGNVYEGELIYEFLEGLKAQGIKITTQSDGMVGSMATKIFMIGDERKIAEGHEFFIHNPQGKPEGDAKAIEAYLERMKEVEAAMVKFYTQGTGSEETAIRLLMDKETILTADQVVEMGFATGKAEAVAVDMEMFLDKKETKIDNNNQNVMTKIKDTLTAEIKGLFADLKKDLGLEKSDEDKAAEARMKLIKAEFPDTEQFGTVKIGEEEMHFTGESLAEAGIVFSIQEDKVVRMEAGEATLEDGKVLTIGEGGAITAIKDPATEEQKLQAKIEKLEQELKEAKEAKPTVDPEKLEEMVEAKLKPILEKADELGEVEQELEAIRSHYKVPENKSFIRKSNEPSLREKMNAAREEYKTKKTTAEKARESLNL